MSYCIIRTSSSGSFLKVSGGQVLAVLGPALPGSIRFRFSDSSFNPNTIEGIPYEHTWARLPGSHNDWEYHQDSTSFRRAFRGLFADPNNLVTILDSNFTGITDLESIFANCTSLQNSDLKNTESVQYFGGAFAYCTGLNSISELIDLSSAVSIGNMFVGCSNISSGILSFYNRAIAKNNKPAFEIIGNTYSYSPNALDGVGSNSTAGTNEAKQTSYDYSKLLLTDYSTPHDGEVKKLRSKIIMTTPLRLVWNGLRILGASETSSDPDEMCARWYNNSSDIQTQKRYGLFYNWKAAKYLIDHPSVISGWHVPSKSEYEALINEFGGRSKLGWEILRYIVDTVPGDRWHYGKTGYDGELAGYGTDEGVVYPPSRWERDGILMLNWTSTVVPDEPIYGKPNRLFCVSTVNYSDMEDSAGDATFMKMDAQTGNMRFFQIVVFKD